MDGKHRNSSEESDSDSFLDLDLNPDGVIRPFEPQHISSSGEDEISVDEETQDEIQEETSSAHVLEIGSGTLAATVK